MLISAGLLCCMGMSQRHPVAGPYRCDNGKVMLKSEASLELIQAKSNKLRGAIDPLNNNFAWSVDVISFEGFNSALQREHFNENYMENTRYPRVTFTGKIIEKVDFQTNGKYNVRAKGKLMAHGVEQERIIRSELEIQGNKILVHAQFTVPLTDHNIRIPHIVNQKIAEEVSLNIDAVLIAGNQQKQP
jgi:polyisoprenoid-binding protein YceI